MKLVVLPAIRLGMVQEKLKDLGVDHADISMVMDAIESEIEAGARRVGNLCPHDDCRRVLTDLRSEHGPNVRMWQECPDHGTVVASAGLPLLIAFDPIRTDPQVEVG